MQNIIEEAQYKHQSKGDTDSTALERPMAVKN